MEEGCRLLAITGETVDTQMLAIFSFGSSKLLNLIVSAVSAYLTLNLKEEFAFQLGELPLDFFVRKFGTVRCVFEP